MCHVGVSSCVFFSSRRRHTRCALVTGVQTCALPILSIKEISGRTYQLDPIDPDNITGLARVSKRSKKKTDIMQAVAEFNSGDCDALIINVAAATGLSMHASPRFKNTQQRELLEFQIPENPTVRVQLYGRVNRFDQVIPPRISILTSGFYCETRPLMIDRKSVV